MSRYEMNKFMMFVDGNTEHLEEFCNDRERFVDRWLSAAAESERPVPDGGTLTAVERQALIELDVGALYEMGCHPYILLHYARAVEVDFHGVPFPEFDRAYKVAVSPHGYPDFAT